MDMKKRYKIAYGSFFKWLIANSFRLLSNILVPVTVSFLVAYALSFFDISEKVGMVIIAAGIISVAPAIVITFVPQYVELNSSGIRVRRFSVFGKYSPYIYSGRYSFDIPYSEIRDIDWITSAYMHFDKLGKFYNGNSLLTCDYKNTLLIRARGCFVISVKDSADFYERVWQSVDRIKFLKELDIDELIVNAGADYSDLHLKWHNADFGSVYYIDENNNEITIAEFEMKDKLKDIKSTE